MIGLRKAGLKGTRIGVIRGDDVLRQVIADDLPLPERGVTAKQVEKQLVSAHAYIGAEPIVDLLGKQAKFILGGRLADPSLFVAPICHELGWSLTDWNKVGQATVVGHLLECGIHGAGGNFADPPKRVLPDLHNIGAPMATVRDDGDVVITKLPGTGGGITEQVVKTQLFYEIHDPATYLTPDITADFTDVTVKSVGPDQVKVAGGKGRERPKTLKVLVGINLGFNVFGESSFGGPGCVERARLTIDVMKKRIERHAPGAEELRFDLHGMNALFGDAMKGGYPPEVRLRIAARCKTRELAEALHDQMEFVYFAAAAAGGVTKQITPAIGVTPAYLDRSKVKLETEVVVA
jgi:hypothetical protein